MLGLVIKSLYTYNTKKYYLSYIEFIYSLSFKLSLYSYYYLSNYTYYIVNKISYYNSYFTLGHPYNNYL